MLNLKTKIKNTSTLGGLICILLLIFSGSSIADEHECVMMGILPSSGALPDGIMVNTLMTDAKSLRYGSQSNGWGVVWYPDFGSPPSLNRSAEKPINDGEWCDFDGTCVSAGEYARMAAYLDTIKPKIVLTHWRTGSSGCGGYVADPHPFYREYDGKTWSFVQNGGQNKERVRRLIVDGNPDPLNNDWMNDLPDSSGVLGCYPQSYWKYPEPPGGWQVGDITYMVDSELYFLLIMKHIKEAHLSGRTTLDGIVKAITRLLNAGETGGILFIMSDGHTMWGFKKGSGYYLNYRYDPVSNFTHIATMALTGKDKNGNSTGFDNSGWIAMPDYQIVVAEPGAAPVAYDIRDLIPGNLNRDLYVDEKDSMIFQDALKSCMGDPNYNENADYDGDGCVKMKDLHTWNESYEDFVDGVLCDDHSGTAKGCCRDFAYCGATYLTLSGSAGTIELGGDIDYFRFYGIKDIVYTIKVVSSPTTNLYLYDENLVQLKSTTSKQILNWNCPSSGTYYVRVNFSTSSSGNYTLSLSVPTYIPVEIDIIPGTYPNCVNNDGQGVIPVAILGNPGFDLTQVDPSTVRLNGLGVNILENNKFQAHIGDVNNDGYKDLVVQIENNNAWAFKNDTTEAEIIGKLYDGTLIRGIDSICIAP
jgi:hypothetical protein